MSSEDTTKILKFDGRCTGDYNLWRLHCKIALRRNEPWANLESTNCNQDMKDKSSAMIVTAHGDSALRVCSVKIADPLERFDVLGKHFNSTRTAIRILVLTAMYSKQFLNRDDMDVYVDEFD